MKFTILNYTNKIFLTFLILGVFFSLSTREASSQSGLGLGWDETHQYSLDHWTIIDNIISSNAKSDPNQVVPICKLSTSKVSDSSTNGPTYKYTWEVSPPDLPGLQVTLNTQPVNPAGGQMAPGSDARLSATAMGGSCELKIKSPAPGQAPVCYLSATPVNGGISVQWATQGMGNGTVMTAGAVGISNYVSEGTQNFRTNTPTQFVIFGEGASGSPYEGNECNVRTSSREPLLAHQPTTPTLPVSPRLLK